MPIAVKNLTHTYMADTPFETRALFNVTLNIEDGEFIGIIGHTGSGKSTLIAHLNALEKTAPGMVFVNGIDLGEKNVDLAKVRRTVGLVFQYPEYQLFEETVEKDIAFGPTNLKLAPEEIDARVKKAMQLVGLSEKYAKKSPFELSGGQKRRVAIAGVLAMEPSILILDEPAAGLDPVGRRDMLKLVSDIHKKGVTIVMVSHSMDDVGRLCDRLYVLNRGTVAYSGTPEEVFAHGDALREIGLDIPAYAQLAKRLNEKGFHIPEDIFTIDSVADAILRALGEGDRPC